MARVRLAREIRCPAVASGISSPRATSAVVRPPSRRRVRATRDSAVRTGWQVVKTSRSRSSPMWSSRTSSTSPTSSPEPSSRASDTVRPTSASLRAYVLRRRTRSMAWWRAVETSQPAGFGGTPRDGHCSRAATKASWATSSPRPTSPRTRLATATTLADSIRHTVSAVSRASGPVTGRAAPRRPAGRRPRPPSRPSAPGAAGRTGWPTRSPPRGSARRRPRS